MPTGDTPTMRGGEWGLLVALSLLWGGSFFFVEIALRALPPFTIVLARVGFAALALNLTLLLTGQRMPLDLRSWAAFATMGALNNLLPFSLIVWGQTQITSGLAAILNATTPLFAVLLAHLLTHDERLSANRIVGVVAGFAGVVVMIGPAALEGLGQEIAGQLAILGAAIAYAGSSIFGRRFRNLPPLVPAAGQLTASTVLLLPLTLVIDQPWRLPAPGGEVWAAVLGLALASTALAYVIYFRVLAAAGATNLMLVTFLIPVSALMLGALALDEAVTPGQIAGMVLIGIGLLAIDGRLTPWRLRRAG